MVWWSGFGPLTAGSSPSHVMWFCHSMVTVMQNWFWGALSKSIISQLRSQVLLNSVDNNGTCDHSWFFCTRSPVWSCGKPRCSVQDLVGPNLFVRSHAAEFLPVAANNVKNKRPFAWTTRLRLHLHYMVIQFFPSQVVQIRKITWIPIFSDQFQVLFIYVSLEHKSSHK